MLTEAWRSGAIPLRDDRMSSSAFADLIARVRTRDWVVYAKPPFAGPPCVLRYLAGYTHRIAISNRRIEAFDGDSVTFRYRDSACHNAQRTMTLQSHEFLRRFLLHVLPPHLVRIRYYGFLANRVRTGSIAHARSLIGTSSSANAPATVAPSQSAPQICPRCGVGVLRPSGTVAPSPDFEDSS